MRQRSTKWGVGSDLDEVRAELCCVLRRQGGTTVCYGAMSGKAPAWPWQAWVFREQQVAGFNLRAWLAKNTRKVRRIICGCPACFS